MPTNAMIRKRSAQRKANREAQLAKKKEVERLKQENIDRIKESGALDDKHANVNIHRAEKQGQFSTASGYNPKPPKTLRYPLDTITSTQDFISFTALVYERKKKSTQTGSTTKTTKSKVKTGEKGWFGYDKTKTVRSTTTTNTYARIGQVTGGPNKDAEICGTVLLPVPAQLVDSNAAQYGESKMNKFVADATQGMVNTMGAEGVSGFMQGIGAGVKEVTKTATKNKGVIQSKLATEALSALGANVDINQLMARSQGAIINPNMEMLFSGPSIRQFTYQFKFTPRYEEEAVEIRNIIKFFKLNMAPKGGSAGALTLKNPNIFELAYQGECTNFLHRFKLCALTSMGVNYTGEGTWATYDGGAPVSMTMDLSFQELTPIYQEDYGDYPYGSIGVGY